MGFLKYSYIKLNEDPPPVKTELFHADGRAEWKDKTKSRFFANFVTALENNQAQ